MPRRTASCVAFIHIVSSPPPSPSFSLHSLLFICGPAKSALGKGKGRGGGSQPPRLTIFQAPKFSYGLCPSSCAHTMRGNGETKRKLYGLNVNGNEKFRQNSYEYSSSRAKPTSTSTTTPTKQTEVELTARYFSYSIRLGNRRLFSVPQKTSENIKFSIKRKLILAFCILISNILIDLFSIYNIKKVK